MYLYFVVTGCSVAASCLGFSYMCKWGVNPLSPLVIYRTLFYEEVQEAQERKMLQEDSLGKDVME